MDDFGASYVVLTDEDGVNYEMEILSRFFCGEQEYVALTPADAEDEAAELEVNILRISEEGGEELLETVADEDELQRAYDTLIQLIFEEDEADEADAEAE